MLVDFSLPYPPRGYGCILTPLRAYRSKSFASCVHPAPTKPRNQSVSESYWGAIMLMAVKQANDICRVVDDHESPALSLASSPLLDLSL